MCCPSLVNTFVRYLGAGWGLYLDMKCRARALSEIALLFGGGGAQGRWVLARIAGHAQRLARSHSDLGATEQH